MQAKNIDLTGMTIMELKSLVYDQLRISEQCQINIRNLNQEISKKENRPINIDKPIEPDKKEN